MDEWKTKLQVIFAIGIVLSGVRLFFIYQERHSPAPQKTEAVLKDLDLYANYPIFYGNDLDSALKLKGKQVWVKAGNVIECHPLAGAHAARLSTKTRTLEPAEALTALDFFVQSQKIVGVFQGGQGDKCAAIVGKSVGGDSTLYFNDLFFKKDPHLIYDNWTADDWKMISAHQAKPGMTEMQAAMSLGVGSPRGEEFGDRAIDDPRAPQPVSITFQDDHATSVEKLDAPR